MDINTGKNFKSLIYPILVLGFVCLVLLTERMGIQYKAVTFVDHAVPHNMIENKADFSKADKECLLLTDHSYTYADAYLQQLEFIMASLWVGYDKLDVASQQLPDLSKYKTVVVAFCNLNHLGNDIMTLCDWVKDGGRVMFAASLQPTTTLSVITQKLGIEEGGSQYSDFTGINVVTDFMIGAKDFKYNWEKTLPLSAVNVRLSSNATVHIKSNDNNPLLWEVPYGKGRFVVNNCDMIVKTTRGYLTAAYSLLQDVFAYPVINSSVFFIDDFPAPVPSGNAEYITRDFNCSVDSFYTNIWWKDMVSLAKKYHLRYTGMAIETYQDNVRAPFDRYMDMNRFSYFGKMLLSFGGEIGYHGYNHQPLCYENFDFKGIIDYKKWYSKDDSILAFQELIDFCNQVYPDNSISTYVPPSNILSPEGRTLIASNFPEIKTLAGVYTKVDYEYEQEFGISDDGIVELPRITYGAYINEAMKWTVINELNFHFINTHFWHPDDTLDVDRGAANGWKDMLMNFEKYVSWLHKDVPSLDECTASEAAMAVERYDVLGISRTYENDMLTIEITNFYDVAYFVVRIHDGRPLSINGGSFETIGGGLYLVKATSGIVEIKVGR